jgi:dTDP-4-dehydrorhamnose 3,5-epimerase
MKLIPTEIPDVVIVEPAVFGDERGWFMETFNEPRFHAELAKLGLPAPRPCRVLTAGARVTGGGREISRV